MKNYIVTLHEVHAQPVRIQANSPEEARFLVIEGEGEYLEIRNYDSYIRILEVAGVDEE